MMAPDVSVVIPTYNPSGRLSKAVASVLAQTVTNIEVIVVDDGSSVSVADALRHVRDPRLRIIRQRMNAGVSAARNAGLAQVMADLVALLDDDDWWRPEHLEKSVTALNLAGADLVYGEVELLGHPYGQRFRYGPSEIGAHPVQSLAEAARTNPAVTSTVVARTAAVRSCGGWPIWLDIGEDWWLYLEMMRTGRSFAFQPEPLVVYKWATDSNHASSRTLKTLLDQLKLARALYRRCSARDLSAFALVAAPILQFLKGLTPWTIRRRLRTIRRSVRQRRDSDACTPS